MCSRFDAYGKIHAIVLSSAWSMEKATMKSFVACDHTAQGFKKGRRVSGLIRGFSARASYASREHFCVCCTIVARRGRYADYHWQSNRGA